ncbi:unnamed protein product [Cyprideis torosa]|uniref:Uncharacterized protein n=1 Tax=Cyprideis torosa TaxID=163714 RepID=A0A7R8ZZ67_9CRUS|nr:unnamed protein product [Cyprideis torosa]CAG0909307.1 unnamed protein product [Cyprideis torosa]
MNEITNKPTVGLALGGGGAKGWAHIGILRSLIEAGITPDVVAGTSIGAVVGGFYACGQLDALEDWVTRLSFSRVVSLMDFRFNGGLIEGDRLFKSLGEDLKISEQNIESLKVPFGAVATHLDRGTEVWLREGSVLKSVRASAALPGLFSPTRLNGHWLVDGGLVNPVPVSLCRALGADFVIAVDLNGNQLSHQVGTEKSALDSELKGEVDTKEASNGFSLNLSREVVRDKFYDALQGVVDRFRDTDVVTESVPSIMDTAIKSINIMSIRITRSRLAGDPPDILLRPQLNHIGLMDFHRASEAIEQGKRESLRQGDTLQALKSAME